MTTSDDYEDLRQAVLDIRAWAILAKGWPNNGVVFATDIIDRCNEALRGPVVSLLEKDGHQ